MKNAYNVVQIGNKMVDLVIDLDTARMNFINTRLEQTDSSLPKLSPVGGHYDVPEMHTALKRIILDNWDALGARRAEGGSCYNTGRAALVGAEALCGKDVANRLTIDHIATSNVLDAIVANMPTMQKDGVLVREKYLCKNPTARAVSLSEAQIASLASCDVLFFPLSTPNAYPNLLDQALKIVETENPNDVEIIGTFHGYNAEKSPVKHWAGMNAATVWVGNEKELGTPELANMRAAFLDMGDALLVETHGERGLRLSTGDFRKDYPAVPVQEVLGCAIEGTAGCGNGVEGATILHASGLSGGKTKEDKVNWLGAAANATAAAATTFPGTTLTSAQIPLVRKGFNYLTGHTPR
ncbi:MAG: hypothetical protein PHS57_00220 [Alphaproteobacteria bacterium]|nr:hypothetical protein [Alphaproteobacteria bacterium]